MTAAEVHGGRANWFKLSVCCRPAESEGVLLAGRLLWSHYSITDRLRELTGNEMDSLLSCVSLKMNGGAQLQMTRNIILG